MARTKTVYTRANVEPSEGSDSDRTWYAGQSQLERFGFKRYSPVEINFGVASVTVTVEKVPDSFITNNQLLLSPGVIRQLSLPVHRNLGLVVHDNHLILGPLIGIFVSGWEIKRIAEGGPINVNYASYLRTCRDLRAIGCFFCMDDILWEQKLVRCWMNEYRTGGQNGWVQKTMPIPRVIYDRCFGMRGQADGLLLRANMKRIPGCVVFNAMPKLRKWETFGILSQNPRLIGHLPEMLAYSRVSDLSQAVNRLKRVYFKPDGLSKGKGVFRVTRYNEYLIVEHRGKQGNKVVPVLPGKQLDNLLLPYRERGGGYIIQGEIKLARYLNRPFDMRVLCQRNIEGEWAIGGIAVRIAAPKSIITSPRSGGSVAFWPEVASNVFGDRAQVVNSKLVEVAMEVCRTIEKFYGCCGELGLDMAVDMDGRIWIIEVNGKPLKVSLERLKDPELREKIYANPIEFAWFLASYPVQEENRLWNN